VFRREKFGAYPHNIRNARWRAALDINFVLEAPALESYVFKSNRLCRHCEQPPDQVREEAIQA
jgi:hypothetical protein